MSQSAPTCSHESGTNITRSTNLPRARCLPFMVAGVATRFIFPFTRNEFVKNVKPYKLTHVPPMQCGCASIRYPTRTFRLRWRYQEMVQGDGSRTNLLAAVYELRLVFFLVLNHRRRLSFKLCTGPIDAKPTTYKRSLEIPVTSTMFACICTVTLFLRVL